MYFGAGDGTAFELPSQLRNVKWATWTCRLGWPVQGAWSKSAGEAADGEGGHREARHSGPQQCCDLFAAGYADGRVTLLKYPSLVKGAHAVTALAHAGGG